MNEVFNPRRFGRLFVKHTLDHYPAYLMAIAVLGGILLLGGTFLFFMLPGAVTSDMQWVLFATGLFLAGTLFTSSIFSEFGDPSKSISSLMLPATALEKFLVGWIYSFVIFTAVYIILFFVVLSGLIQVKHAQGYEDALPMRTPLSSASLLLIYSFLHAVALYGAIAFNKLHFIRTAFCFFIAYGLLILLNTFYLGVITGTNALPAIPFAPFAFRAGGSEYSIHLSFAESSLFVYVLIAVTILFWLAAYLRLKEKQA